MGGLEDFHRLVEMHGYDSETGQQGPSDPLNALVLRQKNTRLRRISPFIIGTLLLLIFGFVILVVVLGRGGDCHLPPDGKVEKHTDNSPSGVPEETTPTPEYQHPSAMVTAGNSSSDGKFLLWTDNQGEAYCHGGFQYSEGDLIVPKKGTYRVFLQITYLITSGNEMTLSNTIQLHSNNYRIYRPLLTSFDTVHRSKQPRYKTMYTSGLFQLHPDDRLRVISSHPNFIVKNEHEVFFGAELLPQ